MQRLLLICLTAAVIITPLAAYARPARVVVGPGFGWGYSPYWGLTLIHMDTTVYAPAIGAVKFDTKVKDAEVYINGACAGAIGKLKTMNPVPAL